MRKKLPIIIPCVVALVVAFVLLSSYNTRRSTGTLIVLASDSKAIITVSQVNQQSVVGTGDAKLRLAPGGYKVSATLGMLQASSFTTVIKQQTKTVEIKLPETAPQPSAISSSASGLLSSLPTTGAGFSYTIDFTMNGKQPILTITAPTPENTQYALTWIKTSGYDPSDYKINYVRKSVL